MVKITFEDTPPPPRHAAADGSPFMVTDAAWDRLADIFARRAEGTFLRIQVKGGGCNGYSYAFQLDTPPQDNDHVLEKAGICVRLDPDSLNLLYGSTLDFLDTVEAAQFVIHNPNATSSCGCGNSFGL